MRTSVMLSALALVLAGCGDDEPEAHDNAAFTGCIKRIACGVLDYPNVSNCVDNYKTSFGNGWGEAEEKRLRCAAGATSCGQVRACYGEGSACDRSYKASCSGGKATYCDLSSKKTYAMACGAVGLGCKVDSAGAFNAWCTGGAGSPSLPLSVSCAGGLCSDSGEACDGNQYDMCSGDKFKSCLDGKWILFDCKGLGLGACFTSSNGTSSCGMFQ